MKAAKVINDLQRRPPPLILPDGAEVSRRQEVIMLPGRQFQLAAHYGTYLGLTLRAGSTRAIFDTQRAGAMRQVGG